MALPLNLNTSDTGLSPDPYPTSFKDSMAVSTAGLS